MRYVAVTEGDKTEAELRFGVSGQHLGRQRARRRRARARPTPTSTRSSHEYDELYDVAPELRPGGARHESLRYGAAIELGPAQLPRGRRLRRVHHSFEDLGALRQLPGLAVQRLMADGYGFGAEGDWKTAILVRVAKVMGAGLPGGASLMEDYTYDLTPGAERILGAHMLEICPSLTTAQPAPRDAPAGHRRQGGPGAPGLRRRRRPRRRRRAVRHARPVPPRRQRRRRRRRRPQPLPNLPVARAVWKPAPDFATSAAAWLTAGAAHHTVLTTAVGIEAFRGLRRDRREPSCSSSTTRTTTRGFDRELRWNEAYYRLAQGL